MSVIVAYSAAATGSPLNKAKPPKHSLNETGKFIILRLTVSPKIFPHCWLCSYCNVSPTQNVVWSYTRYSSQCCIGAIAIPSTSSWTTTKQQCWTNKNVEYQWENGFIVWDYSPLFKSQWLCISTLADPDATSEKLPGFPMWNPKVYYSRNSLCQRLHQQHSLLL